MAFDSLVFLTSETQHFDLSFLAQNRPQHYRHRYSDKQQQQRYTIQYCPDDIFGAVFF
jgi:hypothetical protein